jgi:predicted deacylase
MHAQTTGGLLDQQRSSRVDSIIRLKDQSPFSYIPVTIISGKEKGPVFTIIAGVHGYEYPPIIAVQELMKEIDPGKLKGSLLILPIANVASFYKRSPFVNPIDHKNLNTAFPGSASGTLTEQIADWITQNIIPQSDIFLDIHGGDANEDLLPFVCYYDNRDNKEKTDMARRLSEASGMKHIVSYPYTISKKDAAKYAFKQAVQQDVAALSIEAGKLGNVQNENVQLIKEAVYQMLDQLKMYEQTIKARSSKPVVFTNQEYIKVPENGLFYSSFKSGDIVKKGKELGYITDDFGNVLQRILSPVDGTILYKAGTPPVNKNETLFCIGF